MRKIREREILNKNPSQGFILTGIFFAFKVCAPYCLILRAIILHSESIYSSLICYPKYQTEFITLRFLFLLPANQ